jgi:uncharacterized protein
VTFGRRLFLGLAALVVGAVSLAAAVPGAGADIRVPPSPDRWATDRAGFLSPAAVRELDASLEEWERTTGHQFLVYIDHTIGDTPLEEYAVKAFEAWKVGRKGLDDGLVLFIMADDRKMRIEVGYGLEDKVTDLQASRVINDILAPGFRSGDADGAVRRAVAEIQTIVSGAAPSGGSDSGERTLSKGEWVAIVLLGLVFLVILITNPSLALWLLINILSGGGGGRGGGGRGGFGGGGGRSGGGGASGGW